MRTCCLATALILLPAILAGRATTQLPAGTVYADSNFIAGGNAIVGHNALGLVTTIVQLTGGGSPDAIGMNITNHGLLVWDTIGVHAYDIRLGTSTFTKLAGSNIAWGCVDEDCGMVWVDSPNTVYRSADTVGTSTRTLHRSSAAGLYNAVCWNGSTGGYVACKWFASGSVDFLARDGTRIRTLGSIPHISGCDWSPWSGDIIISLLGGGLLRLGQNGRGTTMAAKVTALFGAAGVETLHQNASGTEMFVVVSSNGIPAYLSTVTGQGVVTTLHKGIFGPSDVERVGSRTLWAQGPWRIGTRGHLHLNMGPGHAGEFYRVALSFSHRPGIALGGVQLHLAADNLFLLTALGNRPGLFNHFVGILGANGFPSVQQPWVGIPNLAALRGLRIFGGAVTYDSKGFTGASCCWGTTLN